MQSPVALVNASPRELSTRFSHYDRLSVRQRKKWLEVLFSFEMKNSYDVFDTSGQPVLRVREEGAGVLSFLKRVFLGPMRPFDATISDPVTSVDVMTLERPFRFMFHRLIVRAKDGTMLGAIQRRWSWLRRLYDIEDAQGRVVARLFGPLLKPWTFEIQVDGQTLGTIRKRWSGLGTELFTDADNFGVELSAISDPALRVLAFAATVLIDVVHFERAKG
ncbi:MAG TPA: phospholipid scramblase-related protein [Pseudomonadota bacterium]|jgi:uncharacterized protein YxjI|nr:phospholipid scramblase-related protein [Pseudomonadota bacterium]HNN54108.1 phospholipid scramblase-related protein [Pseudomonadota bacterium]